MMYNIQQNRKMPSPATVRLFLALTVLSAILAGIMPGSLIFPMLAICFASVALLSIPRMTYPKILLILAAGILLVSGITLFLTRNIAFCFAASAFAPATALLTLTIRKRYSRTCGIILASIGLGIFYLACFLIAIYTTYHRFSLDLFKELYASLEDTFLTSMKESLDSAATAQLQIGDIDEALLIETFRLVMTIMPAILIILVLSTVWLSTVCLRFIFKHYVYGEQRFADWSTTMNRPAAIVFSLSTLVLLLPLPESLSVIPLFFMNLSLILLPGFLCVGCTIWKRRLFAPGRRPPLLLIFLLVLLCLFMTPIFLLYFIAITGVMHLLFPKVGQKKPEMPPDHTP